MVSSRPYRPGLAVAEAVAEIRRCRGTQFSPRLTDLFIEAVEEMSAEGDYSAQASAV
jgi:HD-GYP domain-containing protein (c-di-GMP phosphodiesterase class II)